MLFPASAPAPWRSSVSVASRTSTHGSRAAPKSSCSTRPTHATTSDTHHTATLATAERHVVAPGAAVGWSFCTHATESHTSSTYTSRASSKPRRRSAGHPVVGGGAPGTTDTRESGTATATARKMQAMVCQIMARERACRVEGGGRVACAV